MFPDNVGLIASASMGSTNTSAARLPYSAKLCFPLSNNPWSLARGFPASVTSASKVCLWFEGCSRCCFYVSLWRVSALHSVTLFVRITNDPLKPLDLNKPSRALTEVKGCLGSGMETKATLAQPAMHSPVSLAFIGIPESCAVQLSRQCRS